MTHGEEHGAVSAYCLQVGGVTWLALFSGETLAGRKQCLAEQDVGLDLLKYVQRTFIPAVDLNKNTWSSIEEDMHHADKQ